MHWLQWTTIRNIRPSSILAFSVHNGAKHCTYKNVTPYGPKLHVYGNLDIAGIRRLLTEVMIHLKTQLKHFKHIGLQFP